MSRSNLTQDQVGKRLTGIMSKAASYGAQNLAIRLQSIASRGEATRDSSTHDSSSAPTKVNFAACLCALNSVLERRYKEDSLLETLGLSRQWYLAVLAERSRIIQLSRIKVNLPEYEVLKLVSDSLELYPELVKHKVGMHEAGVLKEALQHYRWVESEQSGTCATLSYAALIYAIQHDLASHHRISLIGGNNFDHVFLIVGDFNAALNRDKEFTLADLPSDVRIIDPWINCSFSVKNATRRWSKLLSILEFTEENLGNLNDLTNYRCRIKATFIPNSPAYKVMTQALSREVCWKRTYDPRILNGCVSRSPLSSKWLVEPADDKSNPGPSCR